MIQSRLFAYRARRGVPRVPLSWGAERREPCAWARFHLGEPLDGDRAWFANASRERAVREARPENRGQVRLILFTGLRDTALEHGDTAVGPDQPFGMCYPIRHPDHQC
jgi:hypothetical protein